MNERYKVLYKYSKSKLQARGYFATQVRGWNHYGYICKLCNEQFGVGYDHKKHEERCWSLTPAGIETITERKNRETIAINVIQQRKSENTVMPIQVITKNNKKYYRWGNEGKLYPTREQAAAQARAAYAAGYKENKGKENK